MHFTCSCDSNTDDARFVFDDTWVREMLESEDMLTHILLAEKRTSSLPSFI
jgi:hypothetical protein